MASLLSEIPALDFLIGGCLGRVMGESETVPVLLKEDGTPYTAAVLIPTINNADELDIVLERLGKQTYPHFEVRHRRLQIKGPHQSGM